VDESSDARTIELIATVSHEIRSPLTTIKGFTKTLIDRWDRLDDDMKQDMLRAINEDADRVNRLLTELLDVSRLEAGKLSLHLRPIEMRGFATLAVTEFEKRSDAHVVRLAPGAPVEAIGDPDKLRQVLANFIENAIKYTDGGTITVTCTGESDRVRVAVTDEGQGIPTRYLPLVFEKFSRQELPGSPTGTGLGLYISKGLVEAQDGKIGVTSVEGSGSTFWFDLPAAPSGSAS
jgi:signal transduction histidine kinase